MVQQGQVFKLQARGANGQALWAYRYRLEGRGSARPQVGGFASRAEAKKALQKVVERLGPAGRGASMTLADLVAEYLEMHQAEPVTIAKLRWLLGKATAVLGEVRLAEILPEQVYGWRLTIPEGHRFEATQALRQVLNRAVAWGCSTTTRRGGASRTRRGGIRRSGRSSHGSRSRRSPSGSVPSTDRWSSSPPPPDFDPRSCSRSSTATSIAPPVSCTCGGHSLTVGSRTQRRG